MFNKKVLSLAVACAATGISVNALAGFDVTTGGGEIAIAQESLAPTTNNLPVGVGDTNGILNVNGQMQVGVTANDQIYIRYDWIGGSLLADLPDTAVTLNDPLTTGSTTLTGGLVGQSSAVFGVLAPSTGLSQTVEALLDMQTTGIGLTGSTLDVRMRVYTDQGNAINGLQALSDQTAEDVITIGDALDIDFDTENATAEVQSSFLEFVDPADPNSTVTTGTLGSFTADADAGFVLANSLATATFANLVQANSNSTATYTGDFSFATGGWYLSGVTDGSCSNGGGAVGLTPDTASFSTVTVDMDVAIDRALCVDVDGTTQEIPEVPNGYTASVVLAHVVTSSSPSTTAEARNIGVIDRNGTTVEVAYVTVFEDYNQRLILQSRSAQPADYFITFNGEDGVTPIPTPDVNGTLQPGELKVIPMSTLVSFSSGTRGSATVTVVAPSSQIDVATTQVLRSSGTTDTVYWSVK